MITHPTIYILNTQLTCYDTQQLLASISGFVQCAKKSVILYGNVQTYNLCYEQAWLRDYFNQVDIVHLDGVGVRLGAKILGYDTPHRTTWADFMWELAETSANYGYRVYLLGAGFSVAEKAAHKLQERYPTLNIVGTHHGYFNKQVTHLENKAVIQEINDVKPDILIVGFGMPVQEKWLSENRDQLEATVVLTGGAVFDYISGNLQRAPRWMTDNGLEWLGRLLIEPKRLWHRYIIGNPLFFWRILKQKLAKSS